MFAKIPISVLFSIDFASSEPTKTSKSFLTLSNSFIESSLAPFIAFFNSTIVSLRVLIAWFISSIEEVLVILVFFNVSDALLVSMNFASSELIKSCNCFWIFSNFSFAYKGFNLFFSSIFWINESIAPWTSFVASLISFIESLSSIFALFQTAVSFFLSISFDHSDSSNVFNSCFFASNSCFWIFFSFLIASLSSSRAFSRFILLVLNSSDDNVVSFVVFSANIFLAFSLALFIIWASSVLINSSNLFLAILYLSNSLLLLIFSTSEIACFLASINNLVACWISLIKELLMFISLTFSIDFSAFALISLYFKSFKSFAM